MATQLIHPPPPSQAQSRENRGYEPPHVQAEILAGRIIDLKQRFDTWKRYMLLNSSTTIAMIDVEWERTRKTLEPLLWEHMRLTDTAAYEQARQRGRVPEACVQAA